MSDEAQCGQARTYSDPGLLQLPFFIASAFYIIGLAGFYIFFVATKKYAAQEPP